MTVIASSSPLPPHVIATEIQSSPQSVSLSPVPALAVPPPKTLLGAPTATLTLAVPATADKPSEKRAQIVKTERAFAGQLARRKAGGDAFEDLQWSYASVTFFAEWKAQLHTLAPELCDKTEAQLLRAAASYDFDGVAAALAAVITGLGALPAAKKAIKSA